MAGFQPCTSFIILTTVAVLLVFYAKPTAAFGAGNIASIAKIEGQNWRHGDIEDTLLSLLMSRVSNKKFSKMDVKRVYFGNWLRDYSQAVDVGTVKYVSAEAIRIMLWVLGFLSFGFGTKEFEVTSERLGCYRPEEHIDNPKDYADNLDARQYDRRLRAPVDERRELSVDERNGLKSYIASEDLGITTSAGHVRNLLRRCIDLARRSKRNNNKADFYEALRLLGTATHCLEDYTAHSNYVELCLIEMGERNVFPHVGGRTQIQIRGARNRVYPIVTGTFGGVDFLHSVMGELSDKTTQSEISELEGTFDQTQSQNNASMIKELLDKLPDGLFGGEDQSGKVDQLQQNAQAAQMQNMNITPKEPEEWTRQLQEISKQIYPALDFHDRLMLGINETIEQIPVLPELIEQLQEQISIFVFSLIAPFVVPIIKQVKSELATGSSEIIASSREKQHIVFRDDNSTDPTHSMLSKDHFTNILNEPAGKTASQILKWAIPQIVECWDDERIDAERTIHRIINGVFHHPTMRNVGDDGARDGRMQMFRIVEQWWNEQSEREKNDLRDKLSREGVENGRNHKEGIHDKGHGCGHPLKLPGGGSAGANPMGNLVGGVAGAALGGALGGGQQSGYGRQQGPASDLTSGIGQAAGEAVGGGLLGSIVGGVVGAAGGSLLGGAFNESGDQRQSYAKTSYNADASITTSYTETVHRPAGRSTEERYGQAEYKRTDFPSGGSREEYKRFEQDGRERTTGYGYEQRVESKPTYGGGYERTEERRYDRPGGQWQSESRTEGYTSSGQRYESEQKHHGSSYRKDDSDDDDYEKKERKRREKEEKERRKQEKKYGRDDDSDDDRRKRHSGGYGRQQESSYGGGYGSNRRDSDDERREKRRSGERYGGEQQSYGQSSYGRQEQSSYGRQEESSYGRQEYGSSGYGGEEGRQEYGSGGYGGGRQESSGYGGGRQEYGSSGYGGNQSDYGQQQSGYGRSEEMPGSFGGDDDDNEYGGRRRQQQGYGSGGYGGDNQGYGGSSGW